MLGVAILNLSKPTWKNVVYETIACRQSGQEDRKVIFVAHANGTIAKMPSKSKSILSIIKMVFKNIRAGIILIFVGIFIPTFFYPFLKPIPINDIELNK